MDATDIATVERALVLAGLHDEIDVDHRIEFAGTNLSGGQKQRISLARVFAHAPRFTILDEPTTGLSQAASIAVMKNLREHLRSAPLLIISHDTSIIATGDYRRTLGGGRLLEPTEPVKVHV